MTKDRIPLVVDMEIVFEDEPVRYHQYDPEEYYFYPVREEDDELLELEAEYKKHST